MPRLNDLKRFYKLMNTLEKKIGGRPTLAECDEAAVPSVGGVYFFFEKGEKRSGSGSGDRVVRVGKSIDLQDRICVDHKGPAANMVRGSVFRKWVHNALYRKRRNGEFADWPDIEEQTYLQRMINALNDDQRRRLGQLTSDHMWPMDFLFLPIGREKERRYIERNAIALLSEYREEDSIDPASKRWLGRYSCS